ncbi:MAG: histidine phosphatase family protein [Patescibacteria group bacterium]
MVTSPFVRAIRTAEPLAKELGIEIITDELLRETNRGKLTNTDKNPENHKLVRDAFMDPSGNVKIGETGESYNDIAERMNTFIEKVLQKYPGKTVFVVSHGYPVRVVVETLK